MADRRNGGWLGHEDSTLAIAASNHGSLQMIPASSLTKGETIARMHVRVDVRLSVSGTVAVAIGYGFILADESITAAGLPDPLVDYDADWIDTRVIWVVPRESELALRTVVHDVRSMRQVRGGGKQLRLVWTKDAKTPRTRTPPS